MVSHNPVDMATSHPPNNDAAIYKLVHQVKTNGVVPFIGAGLSVPYGFKPWSAFLIDLAKPCGVEGSVRVCIESGKYEEAAEVLLDRLGSKSFQAALENTFGDHKLKIPKGLTAASLLPKLSSGPVITTNFDRVLETVFAQAGAPLKGPLFGARATEIVIAIHQNRALLLKIHGDWEFPDDRVLTLSDYKKHYGGTEPDRVNSRMALPKLILFMLISRPVLFLGCSLRGDRTVALLGRLRRNLPQVTHFAIVEWPTSRDEQNRRIEYLDKHSILPIWYPKGEHGHVARILTRILKSTGKHSIFHLASDIRSGALSGSNDPLLEHKSGLYGREREVNSVVRAMVAERKAACFVTGPAGMGKTEVCKEALKIYLERYPGVRGLYLQLNEAVSESDVLTRLDDHMNLGGTASHNQVLANLAREPTIVYLDNAEGIIRHTGAVSLIVEMSQISAVQVLASSWEPFPVRGQRIRLRPIPVSAAVRLFRREWSQWTDRPIKESEEMRRFLDSDLGCLPLAIVNAARQAGQYESIDALRSDWNREAGASTGSAKRNPHLGLEVALTRTLRSVAKENKNARILWALMALFPKGLSRLAWQVVDRSEQGMEKALEVLVRFHLVERDGDGVMHMLPPYRDYILKLASNREHGLDLSYLLRLVFPYFSSLAKLTYKYQSEQEQPFTLEALLDEFENLVHFLKRASSSRKHWQSYYATLFEQTGDRLIEYRLATRLRSLLDSTILERRGREAQWRRYLEAQLLSIEGKFRRAERLYRVLWHDRYHLDPELRAKALLGWLEILTRHDRLVSRHRVEMARRLFKECGQIKKLEHRDRIRLIVLRSEFNRYPYLRRRRAESLLRKALVSCRREGDYYGLVRVYAGLKSLRSEQGLWRELLRVHTKAIEEIETRAPQQHSALLLGAGFVVHEQWAWVWMGRYAESERIMRDAIEVQIRLGRPEKWENPPRDMLLAIGMQRRESEVATILDRKIARYRNSGERVQDELAFALGFRGMIALQCRSLDVAEACLRESVKIVERTDPTQIVNWGYWLGMCYLLKGRHAEAERRLATCLLPRFRGRPYFESGALTGLLHLKYRQDSMVRIDPIVRKIDALTRGSEYNDRIAMVRLIQGHTVLRDSGARAAVRFYKEALKYGLRYNIFLLDDLLAGDGVVHDDIAIIPSCLDRGAAGRMVLKRLRDWWASGTNSGRGSFGTVSLAKNGCFLVEEEQRQRAMYRGSSNQVSPQFTVVSRIDSSLGIP